MFDIVTFGSATRDIFLRPKKLSLLKYDSSAREGVCFPVGSKIEIEDIYFNSGGGGTNTAATFANQGLKTAYCGVVGEDSAGREIIKELESLKINTGFVFLKNDKLTNHSVIIAENNKDSTILAYRGAAELLSKEEISWQKLKTGWMYLAPLTGLLCDIFNDIVEFACVNGIKIAANPSVAQLSLNNFVKIANKIDILILNQEEASFLAKISVEDEKGIFQKIDKICPGVAIMTKGGEGVVVSDGKNLYSAKPFKERKIVDTTGAGDAFGSGFVFEFMRSQDIEKSIQFAMANSAGCLSEIGAKNGLLKKGQEFNRIEIIKRECDNDVCFVKK